jgi:tripartite-type tricarboxylate transporter receptor subunit TctC
MPSRLLHRRAASLVPALAVLLAALPASANDFYAGKSIDLYVGATPGGGYDIYARALGRHIGRHIPGNPTVIVKNMPGAGSAKAAQFISTIAPKDGTAIAGIMPGAIMGPLFDEKTAAIFDPTKVQYVGTANSGTRVCATMKGGKIASFADAQKVKAKFGGSAPNDSTYEYGFMHKHTSATAYDMVVGYRGTTDMSLALERGEIDGICGWDWSSFKSQKPEWLRDGKANILLQVGLEPNAELTKMGVPRVFDFIRNPDDRKVVELVISQQVFQRSYIAPPGTTPAQLAILRTAFDRTMADPAFLEDAQKMRVDIEALPGSKVEETIRNLYASPKAVIERAKQVIRQ